MTRHLVSVTLTETTNFWGYVYIDDDELPIDDDAVKHAIERDRWGADAFDYESEEKPYDIRWEIIERP